MKRDGEISNESKTEYIRCATAKFIVLDNFFQDPNDDELLLELLIKRMYDDLIEKNQQLDVDSLGIWVETTDDPVIENAMSLGNLEDIKHYSNQDINPQFEFFKMTLTNG
jgi:capsid protein